MQEKGRRRPFSLAATLRGSGGPTLCRVAAASRGSPPGSVAADVKERWETYMAACDQRLGDDLLLAGA